jgi:predicted transcriptional regulator
MTVDIESLLLKHKEMIKKHVKLATSGEVILQKTNLTAKQKVLMYLIGKLYSKIAGYSEKESVTNKDLVRALGINENTVKVSLFDLRKEGFIIPNEEGVHQVRITNLDAAIQQFGGDDGN